MIVVRVIGILLAVSAMMIGGIDIARGWSEGRLRLTALGKLWFDLHPGSLNLAQAVTQRYLAPAVWDPGVVIFLTIPAFVVLGVIGILLMLVPRRDGRRSLAP